MMASQVQSLRVACMLDDLSEWLKRIADLTKMLIRNRCILNEPFIKQSYKMYLYPQFTEFWYGNPKTTTFSIPVFC